MHNENWFFIFFISVRSVRFIYELASGADGKYATESYKMIMKENLPLRFCTGGLKCPYNLLKSIPYTENGSDTSNINQINLDIFVVFGCGPLDRSVCVCAAGISYDWPSD